MLRESVATVTDAVDAAFAAFAEQVIWVVYLHCIHRKWQIYNTVVSKQEGNFKLNRKVLQML